MDTLASLPILSYLLGPGASSWSTSINLVFFYITWTTLVLTYTPTHIQIVGVAIVRLLFFLLPSLIFLLFDSAVPSLAVNFEIKSSNSGLPPRDRTVGKLVLLSLFNIAAEGLLQAAVSLLCTAALQLLSRSTPTLFKTTAPPLPWLILKQIGLLSLGREVAVYYIHRLLHSSDSYIARCHTSSYAHTRSAPPFSLLLFADHPLSVLSLRLVPLYLPALVVRPHLLVFFLFTALATAEETLAMSGYTTVPGILLRGIARRTAAHYSQGRDASSNFGAWGVLDWLHTTTQASRRKEDSFIQDAVDEVNKHQKRGRKSTKRA